MANGYAKAIVTRAFSEPFKVTGARASLDRTSMFGSHHPDHGFDSSSLAVTSDRHDHSESPSSALRTRAADLRRVQRKGCILARGSASRDIVQAFLCNRANPRLSMAIAMRRSSEGPRHNGYGDKSAP
jgi:hypothetical protein